MDRSVITNREMNEVIRLCAINNIPFEVYTSAYFPDSVAVAIPSYDNRELDVACNSGTYGHERGLLEIYRDDCGCFEETIDCVVGYLTADKCFDVIQRYMNDKSSVSIKVVDTNEDDSRR